MSVKPRTSSYSLDPVGDFMALRSKSAQLQKKTKGKMVMSLLSLDVNMESSIFIGLVFIYVLMRFPLHCKFSICNYLLSICLIWIQYRLINCDVISEKGPYCGRNSVFLNQLFLHFCNSIFLSKLRREREKCFFLDAH